MEQQDCVWFGAAGSSTAPFGLPSPSSPICTMCQSSSTSLISVVKLHVHVVVVVVVVVPPDICYHDDCIARSLPKSVVTIIATAKSHPASVVMIITIAKTAQHLLSCLVVLDVSSNTTKIRAKLRCKISRFVLLKTS
jgi:hypothetical protein